MRLSRSIAMTLLLAGTALQAGCCNAVGTPDAAAAPPPNASAGSPAQSSASEPFDSKKFWEEQAKNPRGKP